MITRLVPALLGLVLLVGCGPSVPNPGQFSNGTFTFPASDTGPNLDALAVVSGGGQIFAGTSRDLRRVRGTKLDGYSEPLIIELQPGYPAEVNGLVFGATTKTLYVGHALGLTVLDVSDAPAVVGQVALPKPVAKLYREGTTLLALSFDDELQLFSLADPAHPAQVGTLALTGGSGAIRSATVAPGKATFTAPGAIWVVEFSDPAAPRLVARHDLAILGGAVRGAGHLFTGNTGALSVIAMPDDATATPVGPAAPPWRLPSAAPVLRGTRLFMVDDEEGQVYVSDVSTPTAPVAVTSLRPDVRVPCHRVHDTTFDDDDVLWVACGGGLVAYVIDF